MAKHDLISIITNVDQKYIFLLTLIILAIPLLIPMGLPIKIGNNSLEFYTMIEKLPQGSVVAYCWGADSMTWMEQGLPGTVVLRHLMSKPGIRVFAFSEMEQAPMYWEMVIKQIGTFGKKYGVDFVYLGYLAGGETMFTAMATDVWKASGGKDYYGNSLDSLPMMKNIHSAKDINILIHLSMGWTYEYSLRQWQMPYKIPFYLIPVGSLQASIVPYRQTGQVTGWIAGAREAAEYELLLKTPGKAISQMDAQSVGHIFAAGLVILCNVGYAMSRSKRRS
jgi:hypothetical protein